MQLSGYTVPQRRAWTRLKSLSGAFIAQVTVSHRITPKQSSGFVSRPIRARPKRNSISA